MSRARRSSTRRTSVECPSVRHLTSYFGRVRRPSFATTIALLALFVALGGPAEAAKVVKRITSRDVKDHSLKVRDLTRDAVRTLQTPRDGSVTTAKIAAGAVTSAGILDRTINAGDVATNSLTGTQI